VILLAGIPSERPLALVARALEASGAAHRIFDQQRAEAANLALDIADADDGGAIAGTLRIDGESIPVDAITAIYLRLIDDAALPGIAESPLHSTERLHSRRLHDLLHGFADIAPRKNSSRARGPMAATRSTSR
jgi:hypothetical protein